MKQSLGLVEVTGLPNAIVVADTMLKSADVQLLEIENSKGSGYMTIKIVGDVGAVNAAVSAGKQLAIQCNSLVSTKVIPRPSDSIEKAFMTEPKTYETKKVEEAKEVATEITLDIEVKEKTEEVVISEPVEIVTEKEELLKITKKDEEPEIKEVVEEKPETKEPKTDKKRTNSKKKK